MASQKPPLVTISVPTYNQAHLLPETLDSILGQTYQNLEIIVGDDASPDNTEEVVKEYMKKDARIKYVRNSPNLGRVGNYYALLNNHATGKYAVNADGDDYYTNMKFVEQAVELAEKHGLLLVTSSTGTKIEYPDGSSREIYDKKYDNVRASSEVIDGNEYFLDFAKGRGFTHLGTLYHRESAIELGYYTKDIISSDWESNLRMIQGKKIGMLNEVTGMWRKHTSNESSNLDVEKAFANIESFMSPYRYAVERDEIPLDKLESWKEKMLEKFFAKYLIKMILTNNQSDAKTFQSHMMEYDKSIGKKVMNKIRIFRIIALNPYITYLFFKYVIKQEAMYKELTQTK